MIERSLTPILLASLKDFPAVLLLGARQVGKSTLAQSLASGPWPARYVTLDDRTVLDAALTDPDGFVENLGGPLILDEIQRSPDLLRAIKLAVDRDRRPGKLLLAGSANVLTLSRVSETLAGRVAVHELHPFTWAELHGEPGRNPIDLLFRGSGAREVLDGFARASTPEGWTTDLRRQIVWGFFPTPALTTSERARRTWYESYRQSYVERDLRDVAAIEHIPDFDRLLTVLAARTGQMLNTAGLSRDLGLPATTLRRYFNILLQTYQVFLVQPYWTSIEKRLVKTPKLYMADPGLAAHYSAVEDWETAEAQGKIGPWVETWVAGELRKLAALSGKKTALHFWRTHGGREVDFLLERGDRVVGIEVKWGSGIDERDLAGLEACREALGRRWALGVVLHSGRETIPAGRDTLAIPFRAFFGPARAG